MSRGLAVGTFTLLFGIWFWVVIAAWRLGEIRDELRAIRRQGNRR